MDARSARWRDAALVATGGYGRGELTPAPTSTCWSCSPREPSEAERGALERLIGRFWDIGLEIGHSVRTVEGCIEAAAGDITVRTTLLEARYLAGSRRLFRTLTGELQRSLDPAGFFKAKKLEQEQRHAKHQDSPYALEPNLKEAPGGLRDLQVIQWIARASGIGRRWSDLVAHGLISAAKRASSRSLETPPAGPAHPAALPRRPPRGPPACSTCRPRSPAQLGLKDTPTRRASEALMQRYYRTAKAVTPAQHHPAAEPRGAPRAEARTRRRAASTSASRCAASCCTSRREDSSQREPHRDPRELPAAACSTRSCAA